MHDSDIDKDISKGSSKELSQELMTTFEEFGSKAKQRFADKLLSKLVDHNNQLKSMNLLKKLKKRGLGLEWR